MSILWLPSKAYYAMYHSGLIKLDNQFNNKFDPMVGPKSVSNIQTTTGFIKHIVKGNSGEDPYQVASRLKLDFIYTHEPPKNAEFIPTSITKISTLGINDSGLDLNARIAEYTSSGNNNHEMGSTQKQNQLKSHIKTRNAFQVPYSSNRFNQIIQATVHPKESTNWQVNEFLWGNHGANTVINDCYRVTFDLDWQKRQDNGQTLNTNTDPRKFYFKVSPDTYIVIGYSKCFEHKYLEWFDTINGFDDFSEEHQKACTIELDNLWQQVISGTRSLNGWILFMKAYKISQGTGAPAICSPKWRDFKDNEYGMTLMNNIMKNDQLDVNHKAVDFAKILDQYFTGSLNKPKPQI